MIVFLDTQVFESQLFDFDNQLLESFRSCASTGLFDVVITDVTVGEVEAHIAETVHTSLEQFREWVKQRERGILRHFGDRFAVLFSNPRAEELISLLTQEFHDFLTATRTEIIPAGQLDGTKLVSDYFGAVAPFGKTKEKKHGFPDAIAIMTLKRWCNEKKCKVDVVSGDGDWKEACQACEVFNYHEQLSSLLSQFVPRNVSVAIMRELKRSKKLEEAIAEHFKQLDFTALDGDTELEVVRVADIAVTVNSWLMAYGPEGPSTVVVGCSIKFAATVIPSHLSDLHKAGDDTIIGSFGETVDGCVDREVDVTVLHDGKDPATAQVMSVKFVLPYVEVDCGGVFDDSESS